MPTKEWTWFYAGIAKDDYVTADKTYLYGDNIDGSIFGYGATISRKSTKVLEVAHPIYDIGGRIAAPTSQPEDVTLVGHNETNWYVYDLTSADNTPEVTVTSSETDHPLLVGVAYTAWRNYYIGRDDTVDSNTYAFHLSNNSLSSFSYDLSSITRNNSYIPPYLVSKWLVLIWMSSNVYSIPGGSATPAITTFNIVNDDITAIQESGTTILLYTEDNKVATWNGTATSVTWAKNIGYRSIRGGSSGDNIFTTTESGTVLQWNGYSFQESYNKRKTLKAESNSVYYDLLDFSTARTDNNRWTSIDSIDGDLYFIEGWDKIAKLKPLRPGVAPGMHTVLSKNWNNVTIDKIYCVRAINGLLYFSYKAGAYYGVDYIDPSALTSDVPATITTTVFRGPTSVTSRITKVVATIENTSWNKSIQLYYRVDGWSWVSIRTWNNAADTISVEEIDNLADEFVDLQFKAVLTNTDQDDTPPILHSLTLEYEII